MLADVVDREDVGVIQRGRRARFLLEALEPLGITCRRRFKTGSKRRRILAHVSAVNGERGGRVQAGVAASRSEV